MQQHDRGPGPSGSAAPAGAPAPVRGTPRTARDARATVCARSRAAPRSSAGTSSRRADRQLGSTKTIASPAAAASCSASTVAPATARASASRPCEMSGRPQQPCGTSRVPMPARSRTSSAASPISGSTCSVKVSAKSTARRAAGAGRAAARRDSVRRVHAGGMRRRSMPAVISPRARPIALPATALDSGASRLPQRARRRTWPKALHPGRRAVAGPLVGQHLALDPRHVDADRALALARAAFEAQVQRLVQPGVVEALRTELPGHRQPQHVGAAARRVGLVAGRHVGRAHGAVAGSCGTRRRRCRLRRRGPGRRRSPKSK